MVSVAAVERSSPAASRPPVWLVLATVALAMAVLAMAIAETNLWMHYLIDAGESISLFGLLFVLGAGLYLYRAGRLAVSIPLTLPWLLFPVITQGDQLIDNLSINWMRFVVHVLLAAIFGIPVAVLVVAVRMALARLDRLSPPAWLAILPGLPLIASGRTREGSAVLAAMLIGIEMWVAHRFLGELMVATLVVMQFAVLLVGFRPGGAQRPMRSERAALVMLLAGVALSAGLFVGYKNRPGAYQGSPSYFMDPSQKDAGFRLDAVPLSSRAPALPAQPDAVREALDTYGHAFERLIDGYYILDRNYNYDFHNRLFVRSTPLLANYRVAGVEEVHEAERLRERADGLATAARASLAADDPLRVLLDDVGRFAAFTLGRSPVLERMTVEFVKTEAGIQHATHLYEGEGKVVGVQLASVLDKHRAVLAARDVAPVTQEFVALSRAVHDRYANRIVGF